MALVAGAFKSERGKGKVKRVGMQGEGWNRSLLTGCLCLLAAALVASRWDDDKRVEMLEETYSGAENSMREAYAKAHVFERKANMQKTYAAQDETIKVGIIKMAQNEANELRADDAKAGKVEDIHRKLEEALEATDQALELHQKRLKDLQEQVGRKNKEDDELTKESSELIESKRHMDHSLTQLESKVGTMRVALKQEEEQAADPQQALDTRRWDRLVDLYLGKRSYAAKRAKIAHAREEHSINKAKAEQAKAMRLQKEADAITDKITKICPQNHKSCDVGKRKELMQEQESLRKRVKEVEKEVLYHRREAKIMRRTEGLQETQVKTDQYDVNKYRAKLQAAYLHLKRLKKRITDAPSNIKAAELNVKLAQQSDERVGERIQILQDDGQTDQQIMAKDKALERVEGKHLENLWDLDVTQTKAVRTATRAVEAEDRVVHQKSAHIHELMRKADDVQESADVHEQVSERWTRAAMSELQEAKEYGQVAEQLIGVQKHSGEKESARREAKQMRHGLQLMMARDALRRFRRYPTEKNRRALVLARTEIMSRLGDSDDPEQNQIGIEETDEIQHALNEDARRRNERRDMYSQSYLPQTREMDSGGQGKGLPPSVAGGGVHTLIQQRASGDKAERLQGADTQEERMFDLGWSRSRGRRRSGRQQDV